MVHFVIKPNKRDSQRVKTWVKNLLPFLSDNTENLYSPISKEQKEYAYNLMQLVSKAKNDALLYSVLDTLFGVNEIEERNEIN